MFNKPHKMIWKRGKTSTFVRTVFGSQEFPPNEEVLVAPRLITPALAIGIEFVNEEQEMPSPETKDPEPVDPGSRQLVIEEAIAVIIARAEKDPKKYREDFTAGNKPKLIVIAKVAGLKRVAAHEVGAILLAQNEALEELRMVREKEKTKKITERKNPKKKSAKKPAKSKDKVDESAAEDC